MVELKLKKGVIAHFTDKLCGAEVLFEEEKELTANFGSKRLLDFCRGRYCAHLCCEQLDSNKPILTGKLGMPIWPQQPFGIVGSISHSSKLAGALVAQDSSYISLGLDIEQIGRVRKRLWKEVFIPEEIQYLTGFEGEEQDVLATLFFSAKEAFYKMQYPRSKKYLDFSDAQIISEGQQFYIEPLVKLPAITFAENRFLIHYERYKEHIITHVYLDDVGFSQAD